MVGFQQKYPDVRVRFLTDIRVFRLDYGEAHVALRAGNGPVEPDNVVQPLARMKTGLYAARSYVERYGKPASEDDFAGHRFVCTDDEITRAPFHRWLRATVHPDQIAYAVTEPAALEQGVRDGAGIGFMMTMRAEGDPNLVEVLPPRAEWESALRIVTHVDLHRTLKVQAFLTHLKDAAKGWKFCT
jgi:DNA-binding transcriptional LysR family regulator